MRSLVTLCLLGLLASPASAGSDCVLYGGHLICNNGTSGFKDDNGNLWVQGRDGRTAVIPNLDGPQEAPRQREWSGGIQRPDGLIELE